MKVETEEGRELARLSLIDYECNVLLDILVKPKNTIINYNTKYIFKEKRKIIFIQV